MRTQYWKAEAGRCAGLWSIVAGLGLTAWLLGAGSTPAPVNGRQEARPSRATAGAPHDDAAITAAVRSKLRTAPETHSLAIGVDTQDGVVYLTGLVRNDAEVDRALDLARSIHSVKEVRARLRLARA